jgi:hypothetical protein
LTRLYPKGNNRSRVVRALKAKRSEKRGNLEGDAMNGPSPFDSVKRNRGRPRIPDDVHDRVAELAAFGWNHSEIARETRISRRSVIRILEDRARNSQGENVGKEDMRHG